MDHSNSQKPNGQERSNNILLVGMTGCGKTTLAQAIARRLGFGYLDLDAWIETSSGHTISELLKNLGETSFRSMETEAIHDLRHIHSHVIAVGAGAIEKVENWQLIQNLGATIWVDCPVAIIAQRLSKNLEELKIRPLLADSISDKQEINGELYDLVCMRLETMLQRRKGRYSESDIILNYGFLTPDSGALRVKELVAQHKKSERARQQHRSG